MKWDSSLFSSKKTAQSLFQLPSCYIATHTQKLQAIRPMLPRNSVILHCEQHLEFSKAWISGPQTRRPSYNSGTYKGPFITPVAKTKYRGDDKSIINIIRYSIFKADVSHKSMLVSSSALEKSCRNGSKSSTRSYSSKLL